MQTLFAGLRPHHTNVLLGDDGDADFPMFKSRFAV